MTGETVRAWLPSVLPSATNTMEDWWRALYRSGCACAAWPERYGGLGLSDEHARAVADELAAQQSPLPPYLTVQHAVGRALIEWGSDRQRDRYLPGIAREGTIWCQLFSEPGAGSDLASLSTRAVEHDGEWRVTGQKVWSSYATTAEYGFLLARTGAHQPKHAGITSFIIDMRQPGIEVRPLRQMTGDTHFNEVFFNDAIVRDEQRVGPVNAGWTVAKVALVAERQSAAGGSASPVKRVGGVSVEALLRSQRGRVHGADRHQLVDLWIRERIIGLLGESSAAGTVSAAVVKLIQAEHNQRVQEIAMQVAGVSSIASESDVLTPDSLAWNLLRTRANTIAGGTSEVMRNVIGETVLQLPKEPRPS